MDEAVLKLKPMPVDDYLRSEEQSSLRREYVDGQVYAHAGATARHNRVVTNLSGHLWLAARGRTCSVYTSDMKVRISTKTVKARVQAKNLEGRNGT